MRDDQIDALLRALTREGFTLPFTARDEPQAAAWQQNREALRRALKDAR